LKGRLAEGEGIAKRSDCFSLCAYTVFVAGGIGMCSLLVLQGGGGPHPFNTRHSRVLMLAHVELV